MNNGAGYYLGERVPWGRWADAEELVAAGFADKWAKRDVVWTVQVGDSE